MYLAQKNYPAAIAALEAAEKSRRDDADVLKGLAEAYAATQQPKDKLSGVAEQLARVPNDAAALLAAGVAFYAAGNDQRALPAFEAAGNGAPRPPRATARVRMSLTPMARAAVG